jgi:hypothetical protein
MSDDSETLYSDYMLSKPPKYTDDLPPAYEDVCYDQNTPTMAILPTKCDYSIIPNIQNIRYIQHDKQISNDEILKDFAGKLETENYVPMCSGCATIHNFKDTRFQDLDLIHSICACEEEYHFFCAVSRVYQVGPNCPDCHMEFMTNEKYVQIQHEKSYNAIFFPSAPSKGNIIFPDPANQDNIYIISSEVIYIQFLIFYMQHRELYKYLQSISSYSVSQRKTLLDELLNTSGSIKGLPYLDRMNTMSIKEFNLDVVCLTKNIRNQYCFSISNNVKKYFDKFQNVKAFIQIEAGLDLFFKPVFIVYHNEKHSHKIDGLTQ